MFLKKDSIKKFDFFVFFLIAIAIITHLEWFNYSSTLFFNDWSHRNDTVTSQFLNFGWSTWRSFTSFGYQNVQLYMFIPTFVWGIIERYDIAVKITYFWPIALLSLLAPYYLLRKILGDKFIAFLGALTYGFSTYLLMRSCAHLPIALVYSIAPLILLSFISFLKKANWFNLVIFSLVYSVGIFYELRIMYIVSFILIIYFFIFFKKEKIILNSSKFILTILIIFLLNIFWLIPTILGDKTAIIETASRGLWGNDFYTLIRALSFSDYKWTGVEAIQDFIPQRVSLHSWLIPIVSFLAFFQFKNEKLKSKKYIIFFGIVLVLGIILSKQTDKPFPGLYLWLYDNFPGFNLFREASKFYLLIAIGYLGLFAFGLKFVFSKIKNNYLNLLLTLALVIILLINAKPLITKEIGALFINREEPIEYQELENKIQNDGDQFYRTLWVPFYSKWSYYEESRPKLSFWDEINEDGLRELSDIPVGLGNFANPALYSEIFNKKIGKNIFKIMSVKYIIIPKDLSESSGDRIFPYAGERKDYVEKFDNISYLKKEILGGLDIYENENYRPHIYTTKEEETIHWEVPFEKVDFVQKNPTEYKISLKNLNKKTYLNFSESFHPDWKLRAGEFGWFSALLHKDYFLPDEFHIKNNANLSTFKIDPEFIKKNYPASYTENPDGSINVDLTLYFKPQSYFYLGLIISGTTLLGCLGYLLYDWRKRRKLRLKENETVVDNRL